MAYDSEWYVCPHVSYTGCNSSQISSVKRSVNFLGGFVVVAQHWPDSLISILALDLTLLAGFFPNVIGHVIW